MQHKLPENQVDQQHWQNNQHGNDKRELPQIAKHKEEPWLVSSV